MTSSSSKYTCLLSKEIIRILIGDNSINDPDYCDVISMPYLTTNNIRELGYKFGFNSTKDADISSRFNYFKAILESTINNNKVEEFITYLFQKERFSSILNQAEVAEFEKVYLSVRDSIICEINKKLYFSGYKLTIRNMKVELISSTSSISLELPSLKKINREYISGLINRAYLDIERGEFDSALTKSKTLLEEVFTFAIEEKGEKAEEGGKIDVLLKHVKILYNMHIDSSMDKRIKGLISGLDRIIFTIAEMRNKDSDSHAAGLKRIRIKDYHARLFVNSAATIADFFVSVVNNERR